MEKKFYQRLFALLLALVLTVGTVMELPGNAWAATAAARKIVVTNAVSDTVSVHKGRTLNLKVTLDPKGAVSEGYTYTSASKSIATVSSKGKITAKRAGKTTITIKSKNTKLSKKITVIVPKTTVKSVKLNKTNVTLTVGKTVTLKATVSTATVLPENTTNKTVKWTSSDASVATVSNGMVTAVKAGMATITATTVGKTATCTVTVTDASEKAGIYVEPVANISDDFIRGMDASAVLACENSGVTYYNYAGEEQDVFETLAQSGVNYIRLRVWNDPYDENGNGYGGGNNDVATAIELGKRATKYGMKVCIDYHYSDFWADPNRQLAPKAWEGMSGEEKGNAIHEFTKDSLKKILDAGVDVGMVQVGNEINNGMSGETSVPTVMSLLRSGSSAVREISETYGKEIQVVLHYTHIKYIDEIEGIASNLTEYGVDYDVFAMSYYPMWDGTNENMQAVAENIIKKYGKKVIIAETSYCYTSEDGDGAGNSFVGTDDLVDGYSATVQSQATMIRDICAAANEVGVLGVFYWEGTWIPVGKATEDNSPIWEKFGSGWASSYASDYDPDNVGSFYGGCSWDNQAMFDFDGYPLASLKVFKYLKTGANAPLAIDYVPEVHVSCDAGGEIELPEKIDAIYNDRSENKQCDVTWNEEQLAAINTNIGGTYEVTGTVEGGVTVTCKVEVKVTNLVRNPSFEDKDTSMWKVTYADKNNPTDYQVKADDAHTGDTAFHFYSADSDMDFSVEQEFTDLEPGTYKLSAFSQGGSMSKDSVLELYAITNREEKAASFMLTTYIDWKNPAIPDIKVTDGTLTIGVRMKCNAKSWGTVDDFILSKVSD